MADPQRRRGRFRRSFGLTAVALGALALPATAAASTRYAEVGGNGDPTMCFQSDPCSLDDAVEDGSVQNGDEVIVMPGTYTNLQGDFLNVTDGINLHGQDGAARPVVTESTSFPTLFSNVQNFSVHDMEFTNTSNGSAVNVGPTVAGSVTMDRIVATASDLSAFGCQLHNLFIQDSICRNTSSGPGAGLNGGGFASSVTMRNVTIISSGGAAIDLIGGGAGTNFVWDLKNVIARGGAGADVRATLAAPGSVSIALANSNYGTRSETGGATVTDPTTNNNQTAAPQFVNAGSGDFHQLPASPTRNAGVVDMLGPADLDGDPRTLESAPDIGADEFAPDTDGDGVLDYKDNCPNDANPGQGDSDGNGVGDACEPPLAEPVDTNPPDTQITAGPKAKTKKKTASFSFSSTEPGSSFECKLDGGSFEPCTSPEDVKVKKGEHTFSVRAKDTAGNVDPTPATQDWKVKKKRK